MVYGPRIIIYFILIVEKYANVVKVFESIEKEDI